MLIERFCYAAGEVVGDIIYFTAVSQTGVAAYLKVSKFATAHSLKDKNAEAITDNVFQCLEYIDW